MPDLPETTNAPPATEGTSLPAPTRSGPPEIREQVIEVLRNVYDPEIPVNIYDLGLVYGVDVSETSEVVITLTLTSPMCPVAGSLPPEVEERVGLVTGVAKSTVNLVWEPPWTKDLMSADARAVLNIS